eukprot:Skav228964  [mRNA]  locus=scaffold671:84452:85360:+ [translate_table: standard]
MLSPYGVLGLQPGCNQEEVKAAYKKRALETHPDKGGDVDEFRSVKVAYESLLKSVPAQPTSRKQSDSPVSATSVFSPPGVPFPNAFTTAAAQAAVGVKASHDKVQANSRKRRRVSLEETIELAFASIPRRPRTVNEVPPTAPKAKPKPVSKTVAPKSTGSKPGPSQRSHPQGRQNGHGTSGAEDASAAKLWARLLELSLEKRAAEISALSPRVKERLETFLREKKRLRSETKTESRDSDAESDSSSGSSSSSSTSSETKLTTASQKAPWAHSMNGTSSLQSGFLGCVEGVRYFLPSAERSVA